MLAIEGDKSSGYQFHGQMAIRRLIAVEPRINSHYQNSCGIVPILMVVNLLLDSQPKESAIFFAQESGIGGSVTQDPLPATGPGFPRACYHSATYVLRAGFKFQVQVCACVHVHICSHQAFDILW